jgi:hypothetical protein
MRRLCEQFVANHSSIDAEARERRSAVYDDRRCVRGRCFPSTQKTHRASIGIALTLWQGRPLALGRTTGAYVYSSPARSCLETVVKPFRPAGEDKLQQNRCILSPPTNEGPAMSTLLLDLLYREYTRARLAEIETADGFADVWKMANYRRSEDIAKSISEVLRSEEQADQQRLAAHPGNA